MVPAVGAAGAEYVTVTSLVLGVQTPFEMVQRSVFAPSERPVTGLAGLLIAVAAPEPAMVLQAPVPTVGVLAASVELFTQTDCAEPAFEAVGAASTVRVAAVEVAFGATNPIAVQRYW